MLQSTNQRMLSLLILLVLTLTNYMEVKGVDTSDFTFNADVRYSQWVTKSRMNDYWANTTHDGFAVYNAEGTKITSRRSGGKSELDYVPGLVAKAIIENVQYYSQYPWAQSWSLPFFYSIADYGNAFYNKYKSTYGSLDDLNAAKVFFGLYELTNTGGAYASNNVVTSASTTKANAQEALRWAMEGENGNEGIKKHNSARKIENTTPAYLAGHTIVEGGWWHKTAYENEMWLDGSYMGPALFAQLHNYNGSDIIGDDWTIVYRQIQALWEMCWNSTDKLLYHAFSAKSKDNYSATWAGYNPAGGVYHSASYWGRACGWYFLALVDILEQMDKAGLSNTTNYATLKSHLSDLAAGLAARQDATTGCWYQLLDEDGTFHTSTYNNGQSHSDTYNYIESSASALFTAGYLKAMRLGYLSGSTVPTGCSKNYETIAKDGYKGLVNNFFAIDGNEGVHIFGSCRSAGLGNKNSSAGSSNYRNGSKAYYLLGSDVARVAKSENVTEGKILGAFILAATEYERAYQNNTVLFEKDLAPTYSLTAGDQITCPASGSGGSISYKWYKVVNESPVEVATGATFTPEESGEYYCTATSGNTITSSHTQVTVSGEAPAETTYTVTFNATTNGGSCATASLTQASSGASITLPTATKSGYTFNGWYTASTGGTLKGAANASYTPTANETLYAQFTENSGTGGATESITWSGSSLTGVNGTNVTAGTATAVDGSTYSAGTLSISTNKIQTETKKHTNDSYWEDFSGGTQNASSTNATNTARIELPITVADGYTFNVSEVDFRLEQGGGDGPAVHVFLVQGSTSTWLGYTTAATITWNNLNIDLEAGSAKLVFVLGIGASTNLNNGRAFKFSNIAIKGTSSQAGGSTPTTYTVSYNMNGHGEAIADVTNVTALPSTLPTPEATGYTFGGWYTDSGLTSAATAGASISADTELFAKWTANTYSVHFDANGGEGSMTNESFTYGTAKTLTANAFTRTGYTFAGWATSANGAKVYDDEESVGNLTATNDGTVDLYAKWTENQTPATNYIVTFYNGNTFYGSLTIDEGKTVTAPAISPTKQGYAFKGWALENGSTARVLFPYEVWSDVNFYAVWSENTGGGSGEDVNVTETAVINSDGSASSTVVPNTYSPIIETSGNATNGSSYIVAGYDYALKFESSSGKVDISIPTGATNISVTLRSKSSASNVTVNGNSVSTSWSNYATTIGLSDQLAGTKCSITRGSGGINVYCIVLNYTIPGSGSLGENDVILDATTDYENFNDYVGENKNVTLKRSFTEGKWTTLVLPFSVTTEQLNAAFTNASECEIAKIKSMNVTQGNGSIHYTTVSSIEANKPVLAKIKPNDDGKYVFNGVTVVAPTSVVSTSTDGNIEMHGVYKTTGYTQISEDAYFLSGGKFYDWSYLNAMSPFSAYILPVGENTQSIKSISFAEEATGINETLRYENETLRYENSYNLAGQKVNENYNGIVIIKGKKVFGR